MYPLMEADVNPGNHITLYHPKNSVKYRFATDTHNQLPKNPLAID